MTTPDLSDALEIADYLTGSMGRWHSGAPALLRALVAEVEALRRGEFICQRCGLRKDADADGAPPF